MLKIKYSLWITLGLFLSLISSFPVSAEEKIIKIGALYPMTGRPGLYGLDSVDAAEMAIEEINSKGGVNGYKIELINTDSKAKPDYSVMVAKRYIAQDKVHFLFGVVSSAVGLAVTEVSKQHKKIFIGTD
ncbi:MAG: ABC transporter substrate-binding protein, partial [Desulfomonilaceae bacterium]